MKKWVDIAGGKFGRKTVSQIVQAQAAGDSSQPS
jgi:hypothetical protein